MIYVSMYMVRTLCRWGRIYYRNPVPSHCFSVSFGFVIIRQLSITFIILIVFWHGVAHGCTKVIKATFGGNFKYTTWLWWSALSYITPTNYEHFSDVYFIMIIQRSIILTHFRVTSPALNSLYLCANINEEPWNVCTHINSGWYPDTHKISVPYIFSPSAHNRHIYNMLAY